MMTTKKDRLRGPVDQGGLGRAQSNNTTTQHPRSTAKQRLAILSYLQQGNRLSTLHAREFLGIMHPAARVMELRADGYNIITHNRQDADVTGTRHQVAEYVLMNG